MSDDRAPETRADDETERRITKLEYAVFGVNGRGGILDRLESVDGRLNKVLMALVGAALTFGVGSAAVVITALTKG